MKKTCKKFSPNVNLEKNHFLFEENKKAEPNRFSEVDKLIV